MADGHHAAVQLNLRCAHLPSQAVSPDSVTRLYRGKRSLHIRRQPLPQKTVADRILHRALRAIPHHWRSLLWRQSSIRRSSDGGARCHLPLRFQLW